MVDLKTNHIIDMIETRDYEPVCEWLKSYPNLEVVSRDGSITYKNAIEAAHPKAKQISDRFHLLKNLTKYAMEYLRKKLKAQIALPMGGENSASKNTPAVLSKANENRKLTAAEKYDKIVKLRQLGYTKTQICKEINMDLRFYEKLIAMPSSEREALFNTNVSIVHEEKVSQKMERVKEVRTLKAAEFSIRAIARRTGLDFRTVAKYIKAEYNPVHASYGQKKIGILTPYMHQIDSMLTVGMMGTDITQKITEKGYTGSASTIRHYIADWKKRRKQLYDRGNETNVKTQIIERNDAFKLLFHPLEKVECISRNVFETLCQLFPCFQSVHSIVWEFRSLLAAKEPEKLALWLKSAKALKIREINSLAEGKVNKLKLIKRIMYGRCHFSTLKTKVLLIENARFFQPSL